MESVAADSRTADEMFLVGGLGSYALLFSLLARDLLTLEGFVQKSSALPPAVPHKIAVRCAEVASLARAQGPLLRSVLVHRRPALSCRVATVEPIELPDLHLSRCRLRSLVEIGPESLAADANAHLRAADADLAQAANDIREMLASANRSGNGSDVTLNDLVPVTALTNLVDESLRENHPQALQSIHGNDERTFVLIHQVNELWFLVAIRCLQEAIAALQVTPPALTEATRRVVDVTGVLKWSGDAIHLPETIGVGNYLLFRHQLAGSGIESPNYRKMQMLLQMPSEARLYALREGNLMTRELDELCQSPSLDTAFRATIVKLGVVGAQDQPADQARKLSELFVPAGAAGEQSDLAELIQAMLRLAKQHKLWQTHHTLMVETMIGIRSILSIGDMTPENAPEWIGGLRYLRSVLNSERLFALVNTAVSYAEALAPR